MTEIDGAVTLQFPINDESRIHAMIGAENINYDRIVLLVLFLVTALKKHASSGGYRRIDLPFLLLLGAFAVSSLYSNNLIHRLRVLVDTEKVLRSRYPAGTDDAANSEQKAHREHERNAGARAVYPRYDGMGRVQDRDRNSQTRAEDKGKK